MAKKTVDKYLCEGNQGECKNAMKRDQCGCWLQACFWL